MRNWAAVLIAVLPFAAYAQPFPDPDQVNAQAILEERAAQQEHLAAQRLQSIAQLLTRLRSAEANSKDADYRRVLQFYADEIVALRKGRRGPFGGG